MHRGGARGTWGYQRPCKPALAGAHVFDGFDLDLGDVIVDDLRKHLDDLLPVFCIEIIRLNLVVVVAAAPPKPPACGGCPEHNAATVVLLSSRCDRQVAAGTSVVSAGIHTGYIQQLEPDTARLGSHISGSTRRPLVQW